MLYMKHLHHFTNPRLCILVALSLVLILLCLCPQRAGKSLHFRPIWSKVELISNQSYMDAQERAITRAHPKLKMLQDSLDEGSIYKYVDTSTFASYLSIFEPAMYTQITERLDYRNPEYAKPKVDYGLLAFLTILVFTGVYLLHFISLSNQTKMQNNREYSGG